jgi:multiple sugar transport system permease protein
MRRRLTPYLFLAPALGAILVFFALPAVASLLLSFTDFDIYGIANLRNVRVIGLANYERLLTDDEFWRAVRNTAYFTLVGGPLSIVASLATALLLNSRVTLLKPLLRTALFLPVTTTLVAVAVIWRYLYHPRYGLLNYLLASFGAQPIDWLGDPAWAMPAIILMAVWKNFGFNMIVFLAGLQAIPERVYEAALLDGAGPWRRLRDITLPMLAPTFLFVGVITAVGYVQLFTEPYVMTQGGPAGATRSVVLLMYEQGFRWWNMGYAAAVAVLLFGVILSATWTQLRLSGRGSTIASLERPFARPPSGREAPP